MEKRCSWGGGTIGVGGHRRGYSTSWDVVVALFLG